MAFPSDITLPTSPVYFSFKDTQAYNSNYDIIWSFTYQLSNSNVQNGVGTYLTTVTSPISTVPGHYLCTSQTVSAYNLISIAFDTTGYFGVSSGTRSGINPSNAVLSSLIVRDNTNTVLYTQPLTGTGFSFSAKQIIRCRYSNASLKLFIDYRPHTSMEYINLATVPLTYRVLNDTNTDNVYTGFSFCSPLSTTDPSTAALLMYNFHTEGVSNNTLVETLTSSILS